MNDVTHERRATDAQTNQRLALIEKNHLQLQKDVSALTSDVAKLATSVEGIADHLDKIATAQMATQRTNWSNLAAWAGVAIILLGLVVWEPMRNMQREFAHHVSDGHPETVLSRIEAQNVLVKDQFGQNRAQLGAIEDRIDAISTEVGRHEERILDVEREAYKGASYRAGRPIVAEAEE